jgi:hypothetical protein
MEGFDGYIVGILWAAQFLFAVNYVIVWQKNY